MTGFSRMASWAFIALAVSACDRSQKPVVPEAKAPVTSGGDAPAVPSPGAPPANPGTTKPTARHATVDIQRVMRESRIGVASQERVKATQVEINKELEARKGRIAEVMTEYETLVKRGKTFSGSPAEGQKLQASLDWQQGMVKALEVDRNEFVQRRTKLLKLRANTETNKVLKEVRGMLEELSASKGYAWVIDRSGINTNQVPMVLYTKAGAPDLTDELIRSLDAKNPGLPAKVAAPNPAPR